MAKRIVGPVCNSAGFTATEFDSAEGKAALLKRLCRWIIDGMPKEEFLRSNKPLYYHLSMHFGHIAHYNRFGFYETWFADDSVKHDFLLKHASVQYPMSSPKYTWVDVEQVLAAWIRNSGILELYSQKAQAYREAVNKRMVKSGLANLSVEARAELLAELSGT